MPRVTVKELIKIGFNKGLNVEASGGKYFVSQLEYNGSEEECHSIQHALESIEGWMYQDDNKGYYRKYKDFKKKCNKVIFPQGKEISIV